MPEETDWFVDAQIAQMPPPAYFASGRRIRSSDRPSLISSRFLIADQDHDREAGRQRQQERKVEPNRHSTWMMVEIISWIILHFVILI